MSRTTTDGVDEAPARRVLVVDDQRTFSDLLQLALDVQDDLECVGVALTAGDALNMVAEEGPDVVLMDVQLPDACGIEATRRVKADHPQVKVLILTGRPDATLMARAAEAGASGFLVKDHPLESILTDVRCESTGTMPAAPVRGSTLVERAGSSPVVLTNRELTVLSLLGEGVPPKQIAYRLGISVHTTRGYVKSLLRKLDSHSVLEAVVTAQRRGLLASSGPG